VAYYEETSEKIVGTSIAALVLIMCHQAFLTYNTGLTDLGYLSKYPACAFGVLTGYLVI